MYSTNKNLEKIGWALAVNSSLELILLHPFTNFGAMPAIVFWISLILCLLNLIAGVLIANNVKKISEFVIYLIIFTFIIDQVIARVLNPLYGFGDLIFAAVIPAIFIYFFANNSKKNFFRSKIK